MPVCLFRYYLDPVDSLSLFVIVPVKKLFKRYPNGIGFIWYIKKNQMLATCVVVYHETIVRNGHGSWTYDNKFLSTHCRKFVYYAAPAYFSIYTIITSPWP